MRILMIYGLVGLAVAGGAITVTELTSKVIPVFPRNGQLVVDYTMTPYAGETPTSLGSQNFTLNVVTDSITVHRSGEFNVSSDWSTVLSTTKTVTLQAGRTLNLGTITLPEGNITMIRIGVVNATLQRTSGGSWENVKIPSGQLEIPTNA